jgi:hypothetical protein
MIFHQVVHLQVIQIQVMISNRKINKEKILLRQHKINKVKKVENKNIRDCQKYKENIKLNKKRDKKERKKYLKS